MNQSCPIQTSGIMKPASRNLSEQSETNSVAKTQPVESWIIKPTSRNLNEHKIEKVFGTSYLTTDICGYIFTGTPLKS